MVDIQENSDLQSYNRDMTAKKSEIRDEINKILTILNKCLDHNEPANDYGDRYDKCQLKLIDDELHYILVLKRKPDTSKKNYTDKDYYYSVLNISDVEKFKEYIS